MHPLPMPTRNLKGFTLIELLVVVAIIALLSAVVLASLNTGRQKAQIAHAKATIAEIQKAIGLLAVDTGVWPKLQTIGEINSGATNEIWDLNEAEVGLTSTDGSFPGWQGPYIREIPVDPWGNNYFFDTDYQIDSNGLPCQGGGCDQAVAIGSFGPNGVGENLYDEDDIILILVRQ